MILSLTLFALGLGANSSVPVFVTLALVVIGAGLATWAIQRELALRRTEKMKVAAQEIGFTFEGDEWAEPLHERFLATALFSRGRAVEFKNIMSGSRDGLKTRLFDYTLRVGSGKNSHTEAQTVGAFSKDGVYIPYFEMRPHKPLDWAVDAVTHKNIRFESHPDFAKHCFLQSPMENDLRALITPALLTYLEQLNGQKKWSIEGAGNTLIVFHSRRRCSPAELRPFLDEMSSIASSFFSLGNCRSENIKGI